MAAADYDLYIEQGATFELSLIWKDSEGAPINISGYAARMQIRQNYDTDPVVDITGEDGIELGGIDGTIDITITDEQTQDIEFCRGKYDLELEYDGVVTRLIEGDVEMSREVTKDAE